MSEGRRRPPRYPGGRGSGRQPRGFTDEALLSEEEVQRRVNVEGGGQLQAPPPEHKFRDRRPTPPVVRRRQGGGRDAALLLALVVIGLVAIGVMLPDGPLTAVSTSTPTSGATQAAVAASPVASSPPAPTGGLITLPPQPTSEATPVPATVAPPTAAATARPAATATPRPAATPTPTPTPKVTPKPTKTPAPTPATARLTVVVSVLNGDGGTRTASDWTVSVDSDGTASPASFAGSASGTPVTISANEAYAVSVSSSSGYAVSTSNGCTSATSSLPAPGSSRTCTIALNDIAPRVSVTTNVNGGPASPGDWTVSVSAKDPNPASFPGSAAGVTVRFDAGVAYTITSEDPSGTDYTLSASAGCDGGALNLGDARSCTFTYDYVPPPTEGLIPIGGLFASAALVAIRGALAGRFRGSRRWTTPTT